MTCLNIEYKEKQEKQHNFKIGDFILIEKELYQLVQCDYYMVIAVDLISGNRFVDPVEVHDLKCISQEELVKITTGCGYEPVSNVNISYN